MWRLRAWSFYYLKKAAAEDFFSPPLTKKIKCYTFDIKLISK